MDDAPTSTSNEDILDQIFGREDEDHSSASSTTDEEVFSDHEDVYGLKFAQSREYEDSYVDPNIRYLKDDVVEIFYGNKEGTFELLRIKNGIELVDKGRREVYKFNCIHNESDDSITSIEFSETQNYSLYGTYNGYLNLVKTSYDPADKLYEQKHVYTTENNYPVCKVAYNQMDTGLAGCYYVNCDQQREEMVVLDLARQRNVEKATVLAKFQTKERIWDVKWGWYDSGQLMISSSNSLRVLDLRDKEKCPRSLFLPYSCQLLAPCKFRDSLLAVSTENMGRSGVSIFDVRKLACPIYEYDVHESVAEAGISTLRWHPRDPYQLFYTTKNSKYIGRLNTQTCHQFSISSVGQLRLDLSKTRHYNLSMETLWNLPNHEESFLTKLEALRNTNYPSSEEPIHLPSYLEQFEKAQANEEQELPLIVTYPRFPRTNQTTKGEMQKDAASLENSVEPEGLEKEHSKEFEDLESYVNKIMPAPYEEYRKQTEKQAVYSKQFMAEKLKKESNDGDKTIKNRAAPRYSKRAFKFLYIKENALILRQKVVDTIFGAAVTLEESEKTAFEIPKNGENLEEATGREDFRDSCGSWDPQEVMRKLEIDEEVRTAILDIVAPYFPEKHLMSYDTAKALSETIVSLLEQEYRKRCESTEEYGFHEDENGFFGFWMTENIRAFTIPTAHLYGVVCLRNNVDHPLLYVPNTSPKIERLPSSYFQATLAKLRANDYYASTSFEVAERTYKNLTRCVKPALSLKHRDLVEILLQCRDKKEDWLLWLNESVAFWERPFNSEFLQNVHQEYTGNWTELKKERAAKVKKAYEAINQLQKEATVVPSQTEFGFYNRGSDYLLKKTDQPVEGYNTTELKHSVTDSFHKLLDEEVHNKPEDEDQDGIKITLGSNGRTPSLGSIATTAGTTPQGTPQDKRDILTQFMNMEKRGSLTQTGTSEEASTTASGREISRPISIGAKGRKAGAYYALNTPKEQYFDDEGSSIKWLFGSNQSAGKEREITTPSGRSPRNVAEEKAVRKISMAGRISSFTSLKNVKPEIPRTLSLKKRANGTPPSSEHSTSGSLGSRPISGSAEDEAAKTPVEADFPDIETPKKEQSFVTPESSREVSVEPVKKESLTPKWERKVLEMKQKIPKETRTLRRLADLTSLPPKTIEALAAENRMTGREANERTRREIEKSYEEAKARKAEKAAQKEAEQQKQARAEEQQMLKQEKKPSVKRPKPPRKPKDINIGREAKSKKVLTDMTKVSTKEQECLTEELENPKALVPVVISAHHEEEKQLEDSSLLKEAPVVEIEAPIIPEDQQLLKEQITGEVVVTVKPPSPLIIGDSPFFEATKKEVEPPAPPIRRYKYFEKYRIEEEERKKPGNLGHVQEAKDIVLAEKATISEADPLVEASLDSMEGLPSRPPPFLSQCSLDLSIKPVVIQGRETTEDVMIVEMAKEATESPTILREEVFVPPAVAPDPESEEFIPEDPTIREASIVEPDPQGPITESEFKQPKDPEPYTDQNGIVNQRDSNFEELDVDEPKTKMPSTLQTLSKCNSIKTTSSLDEQWQNAEEERNLRRPRKFGYDDMVAFLMQKKDYQAEKLIVSRRKWKGEYKELLTLREWDRLRIEARLDREEELERLTELKKIKEGEMQARNLNRLVQVDLGSSYASIPNTVIDSSTVAKKQNVASAEPVPERVERYRIKTEKTEDDGIEFVEEKKPLTKKELEDLIDMVQYRPRLNIFFALPMPSNEAYEELFLDRIGFDFEIKGLPGLLQLMETEVNEEKPLGQMPWDNSLIKHVQLFYGPYRERMLKSYCVANEDFPDMILERPRKEGEFYSCMYIALFQGRFNTFLELVEELYMFMFNMKEEVRDPDQIPENPRMTNRFLNRLIDLCIDFVDFTEVTRHNTELCPMERYKFENNVEDICGMFAGFLEKHVVLVPILMTLKQEVMEDGQPGEFYKLVMDLPNLPLRYKLLYLVRTTTTHTLYSALRKFFKAAKGLDRLPYIGVGRHHDTLAVLAEQLAETNDFQEVAHILLSARAFEEDDWYHFTLHEILAYQDQDLEKPLFIDPEFKTADMPDELFKLSERPDTFSVNSFENYSMDDPEHPLNKLVKLWKKETPGGAARLFAWLHENGRLPPTHHLDEVFPRYNIPSTLSMELLYDICKRAVYKYFDFLLTLDGKTKDYILEEIPTIGCETFRYENTSFLRWRMATLAGCRSLIPFYHATKIVPICQYCGVSRAQGKVLRKKFDEEEEKKLEEKKNKKRKKDPDEVAIDPNFGANDVNGSMICPDTVSKAYPDVACPHCRKAMFRCSICHLQDRIGYAKLPQKPIGKKWSMCLRCHHGGHAHHLKLWFTKYDCCPAPGCECNCYRKLNSTHIKEWYTEHVEVYESQDNS